MMYGPDVRTPEDILCDEAPPAPRCREASETAALQPRGLLLQLLQQPGEFTAGEVAARLNCPATSIRNVMRENDRHFVAVGVIYAPGHQIKIWRVR